MAFTTYNDANAACFKANMMFGVGSYSVRQRGNVWRVEPNYCGKPDKPF